MEAGKVLIACRLRSYASCLFELDYSHIESVLILIMFKVYVK